MTYIYPAYAYGPGPREGCWWNQTAKPVSRPSLVSDVTCDVAVIGAGFTGLSAALHLAEAGLNVVVLEKNSVGWGASGRNGGFCCLGGGMAGDTQLIRRFGQAGCTAWHQAELDAINLVDHLITKYGMDVDRHSNGETRLAHRPSDVAVLRADAAHLRDHRGIETQIIEQAELAAQGMSGPFFGAMTVNAGFAVNPRKYVDALAAAAELLGVRIFHETAVTRINQSGGLHELLAGKASVKANDVIVATNGYSSETLPRWLAGRYMPTQSSVLVTRPLTDNELAAQGWTSDQMAYDTRNLLHYFRLMPDRRFLFGMRGGLLSSPRSEAASRRTVRRDFEKMFPKWRAVESPYQWSGLVCLARNGLPFVGPVPGAKGVFAGLCFHGNGVAMGSYSGAVLADQILGRTYEKHSPLAMRTPLARFGLGRARRLMLGPVYALSGWQDR